MMSSSIKLLLTGPQVDWIMNTSEPRTDSSMEMETSPSANAPTVQRPSGRPMAAAMSPASFLLELQAKILMSFPWILFMVFYSLLMILNFIWSTPGGVCSRGEEELFRGEK